MVTVVLGAFAAPVCAQEERFDFELATSKKKANAAIERGIERSLEQFNMLQKPFVRPLLEEPTRLCVTISFEITDDEIAFVCTREDGTSATHQSPRDGRWVGTKNAKGEPVRLKHTMATSGVSTKIVQSFKNPKGGTFVTTFVYDSSKKTLRAAVKTGGPKLDVPVTYTIRYKLE